MEMDSGGAPHLLRAKEFVIELIENKLESEMTSFDPLRSLKSELGSVACNCRGFV